ncbi:MULTISPECIES: pseudoazurin [unclassified Halomonas]|uniref:pseudoazurin n=1 Tax=unclassified Halomonas TaxID=2609666 RepID=UPI0009909EA3|nr:MULTISPECIES: pseudoazurin [unclassified Halomonas]AVU11328.1 pseudoazurin [Halomonas sp. 'Soap Lake \
MKMFFRLVSLGFLAIGCLTIAFLPLAALAAPQTHTVEMLNRDDTGPMPFSPGYLVIQPGDTVKFLATHAGHNAATIEEMIPDGGEAFVGNINEEIEVTLNEEGIWGIKCSPHYTMGMVMLIQVGDTAATEDDLPDNLPPAARQRFMDILEQSSHNG